MRLAAASLVLLAAAPAFAQAPQAGPAPDTAPDCSRYIQGNRFILNPDNLPRITVDELNRSGGCMRIWDERVVEQAPPVDEAAEARVAQALIACAPATYQAALDCLDTHLTGAVRQDLMSEGGTVVAHFGLGMFIRNNWGLWDGEGGRPLFRDLRRLGFTHPDDMSSVILEGFVARERGQSYDLAAKAAEYRAFWANQQSEDRNAD